VDYRDRDGLFYPESLTLSYSAYAENSSERSLHSHSDLIFDSHIVVNISTGEKKKKKRTLGMRRDGIRKTSIFPYARERTRRTLVRFRRSSGGWKIELALLTEHYAGIRGSARQKRGEKARERERERERENTDRKGRKSQRDGRMCVSPRLRVDESGSHPLFCRAEPTPPPPPHRPSCSAAPMTSPEFNPSPASLGGGTSPPVSSARD